jgi:uncharacterized protein (UPF0335 family)
MDNFLDVFTKATKNTATRVSLAAKIGKLKVEISTQRTEKDRNIKSIGVKVCAIFAKNKQLDGTVVQEEITSELNLIERIEKHIEELQQEISELQAEFRNLGGEDPNIVDASEVKDASDDKSSK